MGGLRNRLRARSVNEFAIAFAAGTALLLASFANFLTYNGYPLLRPEVALLTLALLLICAALALFYCAQRFWGRSYLEGLLAAVFVDLNTSSVPLFAAAGLAVGGFTAWRRMSLLGPMTVLGTVVLLTTVAGVGGRPSWIKTVKGQDSGRGTLDKPVILHLILDEHIGLEGLPSAGLEGSRLRDELRLAYMASGFAVYGGAYSEHYHTANSIPYMLNYGKGLGKMVGTRGVETGPTEHLSSLVDQGYRLTIVQSDYADLCTDARFHECITYDSSSLQPTLAVSMSGTERAKLIIYKFTNLSVIVSSPWYGWNEVMRKARRLGISVPLFDPSPGFSSTVGSLEAMDMLVQRLKSARPGDAYFGHLLVPHQPAVVGRDCEYLPRPWGGKAFKHEWLRAYYDQVRCTERKVAAALENLSKSLAGSNAIVIVHGDHGSRITSEMTAFNQSTGTFSDADMIAAFSTLFAVKTQNQKPSYFVEQASVSDLLREFSASGFQTAPRPRPKQRHTVFLANDDWEPSRRVSLPSFVGQKDSTVPPRDNR